jgi:hypothetical protein
MFSLVKLAIWVCGFLVVSHFVMGYFGYAYNIDYFQKSKASCQEQLLTCQKNLIKNGTEGAKATEECRKITCLDTKKIIIKTETTEAP